MTLSQRPRQGPRALPQTCPGPGGTAAAVLKRQRGAGPPRLGPCAAAELRIPAAEILFRMCSITRQFTAGLVLDAFPGPSTLDADVARYLPNLEQAAPGALHLCHNQSGLRDYWAVAMLHGAPGRALRRRRGGPGDRPDPLLQFEPGTARFSYVNQNFRILSDILQERRGRSYVELLRSRIFERAGMASAFLAADTRAMPDATEGYEGTVETGFRPAGEPGIVWTVATPGSAPASTT